MFFSIFTHFSISVWILNRFDNICKIVNFRVVNILYVFEMHIDIWEIFNSNMCKVLLCELPERNE